jgi:hypothetical protein
VQVADERHHHHPALLILAACAAAAGGGAKKSAEITFQQFGFNDFSGAKDVGAPGRVRLRQTCRNRTIATVTVPR